MVLNRLFRWVIISCATLSLLVGPPASAAVSAAEPVTVTLLWWVPDNDSENELRIIRRFEELHPHIKVETQFADWGVIPDKIKVLTAAGEAPDVVWIREDSYYDLATSRVLMNLEPFIAKDPRWNTANFLPGVLESARVNGVQYALHRDVWAPTIHYNVDWFNSAGVARPRAGWTYQELLDTAKKLTNLERKRFGMGNIESNRNALISSFGGHFMDEERTRFGLDRPEAMQAIQLMRDFRWVHHAQPQPGELSEWFEPQWRAGEVAMIFWGPWAWPNYAQALSFDWDVAPPLAGPAGTYTHLDGLLLGISAGTKHPNEAWQLVRFLGYDERAQTLQVMLGMASPTVRYPSTLQAFYRSQNRPHTVENYIATLQHGRAGVPRLPTRVTTLIDNAFTAIMNNSQDPYTAIAAAQQQATAILNELRRGR